MVSQKFRWKAVEKSQGGAERAFLLFVAQEAISPPLTRLSWQE